MKDEKILQEEMLSDEQLEQVAGGTCYETADDSRFLNVLLNGTKYHQCDRYGASRIFFDSNARDDVVEAWASLGIKINVKSGLIIRNSYSLNGKEISQHEAWSHAEKLTGKTLTKEQWNW